jgi:hypothetical protein
MAKKQKDDLPEETKKFDHERELKKHLKSPLTRQEQIQREMHEYKRRNPWNFS